MNLGTAASVFGALDGTAPMGRQSLAETEAFNPRGWRVEGRKCRRRPWEPPGPRRVGPGRYGNEDGGGGGYRLYKVGAYPPKHVAPRARAVFNHIPCSAFRISVAGKHE